MIANIDARRANRVVHRATIGDMAKDLERTTGGRIKLARLNRGMSQKELGHTIGVRNVYISQLENNVHEASRPLMRRIAEVLGVSIAYLEMEVDEPTPPQADEPDQPVYISPQADEAAQLIDAMMDNEWRDLALQMVQLLALHAGTEGQDQEAPAPGTGGRLILGKLIGNLKKSSPARMPSSVGE